MNAPKDPLELAAKIIGDDPEIASQLLVVIETVSNCDDKAIIEKARLEDKR